MKIFLKTALIFLTSLSLVSCSYRPILDRNEKLVAVGQKQADADIDECKKEADDYLDQYKAQRAAKEAARKAAIGGVVGAATGAIWGKGLKSAVIGGVIGAGVGAAFGGLGVAGEGKVTPDQMKQRYATNCLAKRGYSVIGWQ